MQRDRETNRINLAWLLRFRSVEAAVQAGVIAVVVLGLGVPLPLGLLGSIIAAELVSNALTSAWLRRTPFVGNGALLALLSLDVLLFTGLLAATGGPYNPFSFLYVVQVALGALVLSPGRAAAIACLCAASFAALFGWHLWLPTPGPELMAHELRHLRSDVLGWAFALTIASGFLVYFIQRVRRALDQRDAELVVARDLAQRHERLAALATLSAGAAPELSTPLSTIARGAGEIDRRLAALPDTEVLRGDVALVRAQVDRCRRILVQLAARAGESAGEGVESVTVQALVATALIELDARAPVLVDLGERRETCLRVPPTVVAQALHGLLRNAQQASPEGGAPRLRVRDLEDLIAFDVSDDGPGMSAEVRARAGEPFFTTKGPGTGMGLGLFLARTTAEQLGGRVEIESAPGHGTRVSLVLPRGAA